MKPRLNFNEAAPAATRAMYGLEGYIRKSTSLEPRLLELSRLRASQINGCAYCIDMHTKDARATGETEQRLYAVSAWRHAPFFSERERAALLWTEHITLIGQEDVSDEVYREVGQHFSNAELIDLTIAIIAINGWNRLAIAFRAVPGQEHAQPAVEADSRG